MMTIYLFRIKPQYPLFSSPITIQILKRQDQSLTFANLMEKLEESLPDKICLNNYTVFIGDATGTKIELTNDHTLKNALSTLRLNKLEIFIQSKTSFIGNRAPTNFNTVPLIKPKVIRWDQYRNQYHEKPEQQRKDSGIELDTHLFPASTTYGNSTKQCDYYSVSSKRPSLNMLLSPKSSDDDEIPRISHSVDSSPSSSPSTIASSSPSSPMIAFSNPDITTPKMKSSKKFKGISSSWAPVDHPSSPIYFCEKILESGKICGQTFQRPYDLARHQTIHLKNRPFVYCQQCGKRFTRVDALRRHERVQGHFKSQKHNRNYHPHHHHHHHKMQSHTQHIHHRHSHLQSMSIYPL